MNTEVRGALACGHFEADAPPPPGPFRCECCGLVHKEDDFGGEAFTFGAAAVDGSRAVVHSPVCSQCVARFR
jgi:hypothetical protein